MSANLLQVTQQLGGLQLQQPQSTKQSWQEVKASNLPNKGLLGHVEHWHGSFDKMSLSEEVKQAIIIAASCREDQTIPGQVLRRLSKAQLEQLKGILEFHTQNGQSSQGRAISGAMLQDIVGLIQAGSQDLVVIEEADVATRWQIDRKALCAADCETMTVKQMDRDWGLNRYFGKVLIINLDDTQKNIDEGKTPMADRYREMERRMPTIGCTQFERFRGVRGAVELTDQVWSRMPDSAVHGISANVDKRAERIFKSKQGKCGLYATYYNIFKMANQNFTVAKAAYDQAVSQGIGNDEIVPLAAKVREWESVVVIQDDCDFGHVLSQKTMTRDGMGFVVRKIFAELPDGWRTLHGGHATYWAKNEREAFRRGNERKGVSNGTPAFQYIEELKYATLAHFVVFNHTAYAELEQIFSKIQQGRREQIERSPDNELAKYQESRPCYGAKVDQQFAFQYSEEASSTTFFGTSDTTTKTYFQGGVFGS